jgi:hypothetical protein
MWRGLVDTRGIEDPKLFVWPGRGVYAVFNRKPRAIARPDAVLAYGTPPAPEACPDDEPWLQQFIAAVRPSAGAGEWALREPVALRVTVPGFYDEQRAKRQIIKEKNWMPLVADDRLYMVHSIHPQHLVFQIARDGSTPRQLASSWPPRLGALLEGRDVHGGPPAVHVTGAMLEGAGLGGGSSGSGDGVDSGAGGGRRRGYHLGVLHYFTKNATWSKTRGKDTKVRGAGERLGSRVARVAGSTAGLCWAWLWRRVVQPLQRTGAGDDPCLMGPQNCSPSSHAPCQSPVPLLHRPTHRKPLHLHPST